MSQSTTNNKSYPPVQIAFERFGEVARLAAIQELRIRLLANKTKAIQDSAYEHHVAETNKKIIEHFTQLGHLDQVKSELLTKSQTIRNKILHCKFNTAVKRIEELVGASMQGPPVQVIKVDPNAGGEELLKTIFAVQESMATGKPGPHQSASQMSDRDVGIFGGLLNCVQTGAMDAAIQIFEKSNALLDGLMGIETTITSTNNQQSLPTSKSTPNKDDK